MTRVLLAVRCRPVAVAAGRRKRGMTECFLHHAACVTNLSNAVNIALTSSEISMVTSINQ